MTLSVNKPLAYGELNETPIKHCPAEVLNFLAVFKKMISFC